MTYDIRKGYYRTGDDSRYFIIARSEFLIKFITSKFNRHVFDSFERYLMLTHSLESLLINMCEFTFYDFLFNRKIDEKFHPLKKMQALRGHSMADLCIKDPIKLRQLLNTKVDPDFSSNLTVIDIF